MKFNLDIIMSDTEGVLERVLAKLRQRGFSLNSLSANRVHEHSSVRARITVEGARAIDPAVKQLSKLFDVKYVAVALSSMEATVPHVHHQIDAQEPLGLCASL
jgi:acetolactate synthase regulatory subunit